MNGSPEKRVNPGSGDSSHGDAESAEQNRFRVARRPTLKAVAKRAGVSLATASYALSNHPKIPEGTRRRVEGAARALGYRTNATVSRLMAELRTDGGSGATLAWVNCSPQRDTYTAVPWMRGWLNGARSRAGHLGYRLEEFWLSETGGERLLTILKTRAMAGVIIAPTRTTGGIIPMDIRAFSAVSMAGAFTQPVVHQAAPNNFANAALALREMVRLGYRKIGFFSSQMARDWTDRQHVGAFLEWQGEQPEKWRSPPLICDESDPDAETAFRNWVKSHRFDAVLSTTSRLEKWLARMGLRVPEDIGMAHLNLAEDVAGWAGINPLIEEAAAAAVDLLVGQIHRHETGPPPVQKITTIRGVWVPGRTLRHAGT